MAYSISAIKQAVKEASNRLETSVCFQLDIWSFDHDPIEILVYISEGGKRTLFKSIESAINYIESLGRPAQNKEELSDE